MAAAENVSEDGAAALPIKEAIPSILDGTFFKIAKVDEGGKVLAKCCNCAIQHRRTNPNATPQQAL